MMTTMVDNVDEVMPAIDICVNPVITGSIELELVVTLVSNDGKAGEPHKLEKMWVLTLSSRAL